MASVAIAPEARGGRSHVWRRLRRDRVTLAAAGFIVVLLLAVFVGAPVAHRVLGHGPLEYFAYATNDEQKPVGPWTWVPDQASPLPTPTAKTPHTLFILGADGQLGHDEFLQLLYGGQTTLEIAFGATFISILFALVFGAIGGYYGGALDGLFSRATEFVAAFPFLLFVIALGYTIGARLNDVTLGFMQRGVLSLALVIGLFTWAYPARIIRSQILSLREQEFVDAARMMGSRGTWIIRKHLLAHIAGTLAVYGSLVLATNIVLEAALSVLNVGLQSDTPDWGTMLSNNYGTILFRSGPSSGLGVGGVPLQVSAWTQVIPAVAVLTTVVAFALLGEGIRRALDAPEAA